MAATPNNQPEKIYYLSLLVNKRAMLPRFYGIQHLSTLKKRKIKRKHHYKYAFHVYQVFISKFPKQN